MGMPPSGSGGGAGQEAAGGAVQHVKVAVAPVHAQHTFVGGQNGADHGRAVLLIFGGGLEVADKIHVVLAEGVADLLIEFVNVVAGHGVHEERAHHHHQRHDEQHHDEHQLHMERAKHTPSPPVPLCNIICYFSSGWELK